MLAFKTPEEVKFISDHFLPMKDNKAGTENLVVAMEELAELQQQISKCLRGKADHQHLVEEIADALIVIDKVMLIEDVTESELSDMLEQKKLKHRRYLETLS